MNKNWKPKIRDRIVDEYDREAIFVKLQGIQGEDQLLLIEYLDGNQGALWQSRCKLLLETK